MQPNVSPPDSEALLRATAQFSKVLNSDPEEKGAGREKILPAQLCDCGTKRLRPQLREADREAHAPRFAIRHLLLANSLQPLRLGIPPRASS